MIQSCSEPLGHSSAITCGALETDCVESLVPASGSQPVPPSAATAFPTVAVDVDGIVFFRPVEGNLAHHTFIGTSFQSNFDCMVQILSVAKVERERDGQVIREIVLGPSVGEPKVIRLSKLAFGRLSTSLKIWEPGESSYHVFHPMFLGHWLAIFEFA